MTKVNIHVCGENGKFRAKLMMSMEVEADCWVHVSRVWPTEEEAVDYAKEWIESRNGVIGETIFGEPNVLGKYC